MTTRTPVAAFDLRLLERADVALERARAEHYLADGLLRAVRLDDYLIDATASRPDHVALVGVEHDTGRRRSLTYGQYASDCTSSANGLRALGVGEDTTVSVLLPNVVEFAVVIFATLAAGGVYSGIPITSGPREIAFMLRRAKSRVLVTQRTYRNRDLVSLLASLVEECPDLTTVVVVDPVGPLPSGGRVAWLAYADLKGTASQQPNAGDVRQPRAGVSLAHVGFTSGTTGEPKGVMNTHGSLDAVLSGWIAHIGDSERLGTGTVNFIPSPIGHHTGFLWGVLLSARLRGTAVLVDRWNPARARDVMAAERVTFMMGAPTFLRDLLDAGVSAGDLPTLDIVSIPGAPIPRGLVTRAARELDCFICPAWGMTEYGIGLSAAPGDPGDRVTETDGSPVGPCEVRIDDAQGRPLEVDVEGDLLIRGPGLFVGYLDRPDFVAESFDDGWFRTGDRALRDAAGFVTLVGRAKDVIIRGGLKIPVAQIESLLNEHEAVADVALVAIPDERLGERACACVVVRDGAPAPTVATLADYLLGLGVSQSFLPERVLVIDAMPRTMSGKIRKVELREVASQGVVE